MNVQVGTLRRLIPQDPAAADEMAAELREELRGAIADMRCLVCDLRPLALDDLGLAKALRRFAERYGSDGDQPRVSVEAPADLPNLPAAVKVAAYRIAQEALTDVAVTRGQGHASCGSPWIEIWRSRSSTTAPASPRGVTRAWASPRCASASEPGGSCVIQSVPEGGTLVLFGLPLANG